MDLYFMYLLMGSTLVINLLLLFIIYVKKIISIFLNYWLRDYFFNNEMNIILAGTNWGKNGKYELVFEQLVKLKPGKKNLISLLSVGVGLQVGITGIKFII